MSEREAVNLLHQNGHDRLDGVHPVLRLVEDDGRRTFKDLIRDFHGVQTEFFAHLLADGGLEVVEGGQAVHKAALGTCVVHQGLGDLVGGKIVDPLGPYLHGLAHGDPDVGVDDVGALGGFQRVFQEGERRAGLRSHLPAGLEDVYKRQVDKVAGLKMGADDYITKPFEMKEVLARIEAVLRRGSLPEESTRKRLTFDKLVIDLDSFELIVDGRKIDTPPKEMELLYHLASSPNRVYTRNQLLDEVWGFDYFGDSRTVDVHIKRLREKLEGVSDQWCLKTVWGVGYKFEVQSA